SMTGRVKEADWKTGKEWGICLHLLKQLSRFLCPWNKDHGNILQRRSQIPAPNDLVDLTVNHILLDFYGRLTRWHR
ncbi:MAG: hypothetical protein WA434_10260, partial [Candidatus Acidiferrales bacterium]